MVTSYYIMKMINNKKSIDTEEYYSGLKSAPRLAVYNKHLKCRVCLQDGEMAIFGSDRSQSIKEALELFGEFDDLNNADENPKYLCNICYKFIKSAILFRIIVQRTNEILKQPIEVQSPEHIREHDQDSSEDDKLNSNSIYEDFSPPVKPPKVQCGICQKMFSKRYYTTHLTMHNPKHHNQYVCDTCGKSFRLRVSYYKHRLRHRTDYTFKCQMCPFKARYDESLKRHMRSHIRDYKYMCTDCPARFLYKSNLNYHIMVKHKEPGFKCGSCDKAFHTKLSLDRHHDVEHLGNKSHACNICGRAFGYRKAMVKHQIRVHKREKLKLRFNNSNYKPMCDSKE
ncbi:zinc finger protein OZF-like [Maniola hyperantus]|uniref:zinc finger protein OZF-like n=1 Tax=Aphantopus hyperantus TaxID=2795564 RepID=UPI00156893C4|nr:zinc finger protein 845-like [Maniola hyperantus]